MRGGEGSGVELCEGAIAQSFTDKIFQNHTFFFLFC